jgi:hypothetical protein
MSAFKGTPGPWQVVNGTDIFTRLGGRNASGVEAAWNDGWHIADCDMGPSFTEEGQADIPYAEKQANARLFAAAPELLNLAERVARLNRDAGEIGAGMLAYLIDEARAAIAKATGEQP